MAAGGSYQDLVVHIEPQADYDGVAVKWGINHKMATAQVGAAFSWLMIWGGVSSAEHSFGSTGGITAAQNNPLCISGATLQAS
jgi:hypothetical protein